ncbi:MAG: hypothetical protein Q8N68_02020 [bacterium]|nr:hypothetical protein [bacterium]
MSKYLFFSITFLLLAFSISAAPMPWGIALNEKTNECAGYWGGDEFRFNPLPEGWIAIYSWSDNWNKISGVEECGLQGKDTSLYSKLCCDKLGYRYVSENIGRKNDNENIGKQNIIEKNNSTIIILIGGAVTSIVIFMLFRLIKNRK